ncbi:DUF4165 domain-containing protein [Burkholderia gladioli]|uniref:DUF4165 domain-containing protein n=1 Tax=Burkholderia gladioli TaxID=28095 RepID=UPI001C5EDF60|nr:DUF4165 domain-containing protein [Burkholderia gladioli]MBW5284095.1 DUF4165 domain-containing protein [Burkholderia gladioli]
MQIVARGSGGGRSRGSPRLRSMWRAAALALGLGLAGAAHADLLQYSFTAVDGTQKTLAPNAGYANASGNITFTLDAGVTNKVQVKLLNSAGQTLSSAVSGQLGPSNTLMVNGGTYYGAQLQLATPADGVYTIEADILDSTGKLLTSNTYPMVQISKGPGAGSIVGQGYGMCNSSGGNTSSGGYCTIKSKAVIGPNQSTIFGVSNVTDTGGGIASATLTTKSLDGSTVYYHVPAQYNASSGIVTVGDGSNYIGQGTFPSNFIGPVVAEFDIYDKAGNKTTVSSQFIWTDEQQPSWSIAGVYDPSTTSNLIAGSPFTGYDPYTPGMTVHTNPVQYIVKVPLTDWYQTSPTGWYVAGSLAQNGKTADFQDSQYAYKVVSIPYSSTGNTGQYLMWQSTANWGGAMLTYNLKLASGVAGTPSVSGFTYTVNGKTLNASIGSPHFIYNSDITFGPITVNAAPQSYDQIVSDTVLRQTAQTATVAETSPGTYQCTIPAGKTSCQLNVPTTRAGSSGTVIIWYDDVSVANASGSLFDPDLLIPIFDVDEGAPVITSSNFNQQSLVVSAAGTKPTVGQAWSDLSVKSAQVTATSQKSGTVTNLSTSMSTSGNAFSANASATSLSDGYYDFGVVVTDSAGNVATQDVGTYLVDRTAPSVGFNVTNGGSVSSISNILTTLSDPFDPSPTVQSAALTGGPTNINIQLPVQATSTANQFALLYPVLFPSLSAGQSYTLTVTATNKYGIAGTKSVSFLYAPPTITPIGFNNGVARMPAIPQVVTTVKTPALTLSNGQPVTGQYEVQATLRSDSTIPLSVGGVSVQPGTTVTVSSSYDLTKSGSVLTFPVSPVTTGAVGKAYLLLTTLAPNAPVVEAEIDTWTPSQEISLVPVGSASSYTVDVAPMTLKATQSQQSASDCVGGVEYALPANITARGGTLAAGGYSCAIQIDDSQGTATSLTTTSQGVQGYLHAVGQNSIVYETGVLYRDPATNQVSFYSAGQQALNMIGTSLQDAAPTIQFLPGNGTQAANSSLTNPVALLGNNQYAGDLKATAPNPGLTMVVTDPTGKKTTLATQNNSVGDQVYTSDNTLWDKQDFGFDTYYTRRPDVVWHTDLNLTVEPATVTINLSRQSGTLVSTADATISGQVGVQMGGKLTYIASTMGDWRVQAYEKVVTRGSNGIITNTSLQPLGTAPIAVNSDGTFAVPVGELPAGSVDIVIKATLFNNGTATDRTISAADLQLSVQDGSAIPATIKVAQATSGVITSSAPFVPAINVLVDTKRQQNISVIHWFVSTDGGTTWQAAGDTTALGLRPSLTTSGTYTYKADVVNKYSGLDTVTNTVSVEAFQRPNLSISGPTAGYVGTPVTFTAVSNLSDTAFSWTVRNGYADTHPQTFTGSTVTVTPTTAGTLYITLAGQEATGTIANPVRAVQVSGMYAVASLKLPQPVITGSRTLETGKTATFNVVQNSPFMKSAVTNQQIDGQWVLPDGTTQSGFNPLSFTVQPGQAQVQFQSWVDGLQSSSTTTTTYTFTTWTYVFPQMVLSKSMPNYQAPAQGVFIANYKNPADARNTGGEKFTYTWSLPAGTTVVSKNGSTMGLLFSQPGDQQVAVTIADTRGNSQTLTQTVTVLPPAQLAATLALQGSDKWSRAPSNVQAHLTITSMPKSDQLQSIVYSLDGAAVLTSTNASALAVIPVPTAGDHTISATITTKSGATTTASQSFSLITGDSPTCTITQSGSSTNIVLRESCVVDQGSIAGVKWSVNGQPTNLSAAYITFSGTTLATLQNASVTATTDKGQTGTATWTMP